MSPHPNAMSPHPNFSLRAPESSPFLQSSPQTLNAQRCAVIRAGPSLGRRVGFKPTQGTVLAAEVSYMLQGMTVPARKSHG